MAHALEASEATMAPLSAITHKDIALFVKLISVGGETRSHGEGVARGEAQTYIGGEVTPRLVVCG